MGASSFSPSPITTMPSIWTVSSISRMASTAAPSAFSFSPSPTQRAAASAPYSVTRTSSMARLRSGRAPAASVISHHPRWLAAYASRLAHESAERDARAAHEPDPVTDLDRDVHVLRVVSAWSSEDDAVDEDQRERRDPHDHRHLPRPPGQVVAAGDDVGEDERGRACRHQQPVEDAVGGEGAEAAAVAVERRVRVAALRHAVLVATRREPVQEQREEQDRRADEADDLGALDAPDVERRARLLLRVLVVARARPAAQCPEDHADADGDRQQPDLRVREVSLRLLVEQVVDDQDEPAEQRAAEQPAQRPLARALVLGAGRVAAEQREDREHEVGGLVDAEQPAA